MWSLEGILKRERTSKGGNHVTDGKVVGSLKRGVSIDWSPMNIYLHVGSLSGPPRDRRSYSLNAKQAKTLGLSLLMAAAELEVALARQAQHVRDRKREERTAARRARQKTA